MSGLVTFQISTKGRKHKKEVRKISCFRSEKVFATKCQKIAIKDLNSLKAKGMIRIDIFESSVLQSECLFDCIKTGAFIMKVNRSVKNPAGKGIHIITIER